MITVDHLSRLGPALKDLRWAARKTQAEIRDATGMNAPQLSRYENGHEVPSLESLVKYLSALDCDLCDLQRVLTGDASPKPKVDREAALEGLANEVKKRLREDPDIGEFFTQTKKIKKMTREERLSLMEDRLRELGDALADFRKK